MSVPIPIASSTWTRQNDNSSKHFVFDNETEALKCAEQFGSKAKVVYRGDYRHDWLVSVAE
jgi:hypothetical protein